MAYPSLWSKRARRNLPPEQYLAFVQTQIRRERAREHRARFGGQFAPTSGENILLFEDKNRRKTERQMSRKGYTKEEIDEFLFTPQYVLSDGAGWQRTALEGHARHLDSIARSAKAKFTELSEGLSAPADLSRVAIGVGDIPTLNAGADFVPSGGAYVLLARGLIHLPMWFAALRRLPRPWNELPLEGEPLRLLLGTAGVAAKAMYMWTMSGFNSFTHELLTSPDRDSLFGFVIGDDWHRPESEALHLGQRKENVLCDRFIVAHELSHVVLGHTEQLREWGPPDQWPEATVSKRLAKMRQDEFDADALGLRVMVELSRDSMLTTMNDGKHVFIGQHVADALVVLFMLFHVTEESPEEVPLPQRSHPPALERLRRLLDQLLSWQGRASRDRFFREVVPTVERDCDVLRQMLGAAVHSAHPKLIYSPDSVGQ